MIENLFGLLKSLGYDRPIHGLLSPMPIGLATGALLFFAAALLFKRRSLALSARHVSILALAFAVPVILFGAFDWIHFYHGAFTSAIKIKMGLSLALLVLLGAGIIAGGEAKPRGLLMLAIYVLSFAAVAALGLYGSSIAYSGGGGETLAIGLSEAPRKAPQKPSERLDSPRAEAAGEEKGEAGEAIFESDCAGCHPGGENVIVASLPIKGSKRLAGLEAFRKFLRSPAMPDGKAGDMPPFAVEALGDDKVSALYSFVIASYKK
jgi:mono/diheme cytochrome c family protein